VEREEVLSWSFLAVELTRILVVEFLMNSGILLPYALSRASVDNKTGS